MTQKKLSIAMEATLTLELSEEEFRILHHLTSYGLAKQFYTDYSKQIPEKRIEDALRGLSQRTGEAVKVIDAAKKRVFQPDPMDLAIAQKQGVEAQEELA